MSDMYTEFQPATGMDTDALARDGFGMVQYGPPDKNKIVLFYIRSVRNAVRSIAEGRPINENKNYVKIQEPGEKSTVWDREITEQDKHRWPHQWRQFCQNQKQIPDGTPIDLLYPGKPNVADTLRSYGVHTVEQLAHLSAEGISTVGMGAQEWVNKAKDFMGKAEKGVAFHQHTKDLAERDTRIAIMEHHISELTKRLEAMLSRPNSPVDVGGSIALRQPSYMPPDETGFDAQTEQLNASHPSAEPNYELPPSAFVGQSEPSKHRGWPKGKPRGPRQPKGD